MDSPALLVPLCVAVLAVGRTVLLVTLRRPPLWLQLIVVFGPPGPRKRARSLIRIWDAKKLRHRGSDRDV